MSQENSAGLTSSDMRRAAFAAPSTAIERRELDAATQKAHQERLASLGDSAAMVLDLEAELQREITARKRAQQAARFATNKLEEMQRSMSAILGRDTRQLGLVQLGAAMSDSKFKLGTLAGYIDQANTLDDLNTLKRIASNMNVIQPQTLAENAALMGLSAAVSA